MNVQVTMWSVVQFEGSSGQQQEKIHTKSAKTNTLISIHLNVPYPKDKSPREEKTKRARTLTTKQRKKNRSVKKISYKTKLRIYEQSQDYKDIKKKDKAVTRAAQCRTVSI